jgi:hypothetical protein
MMPKRENARQVAAWILSGSKLRQLEAAGITVVWQDEWEYISEFNRFWSKYWRYRGKPYNDLEEDGLKVVEREEWERLKRLEAEQTAGDRA